MSNQLQITGGAKVRNLEGVITGSTGVLSSLPINGSNGIPQLDSSGKILVSQLPNSVMEYQGTWNVATNTPYLVNGVGNAGDVYLVTGAAAGGTNHNFGAGNILFYNGDQTIYDGSAWQRASGSTGTVTSVAVTESSAALNITGSPITTSGTINIGFAGTSAQYVAGDGSLITFPALTGYVPYTGATADVDLGTHKLSLNSEQFASISAPSYSEGALWYDSTQKALAYYNDISGNVLHIGQEVQLKVHNNTGSTIAKGAPVYVTSTSSGGSSPNVALAKADTFTTSNVIGLANQAIPTGTDGYITLSGLLTGVSTGAFTVGDILYLSPYSAGQLMNTLPPTGYAIKVGVVSYSNSPNGTIYINQSNAYSTAGSIVGTIAISQGGTGATTAASALSNLGAAASSRLISTTTPLQGGGDLTADRTLSILQSGASQSGYLSSTDWNTFNNKQNALGFVPIGGSGSANYISKFTGSTTISQSGIYEGVTNYISIGNTNTTYNLDVTGTARFTGQLILGSTITNGTYTYTLPNATGTLALTSQIPSLSGYVTGTAASGQVSYFNGTSSIAGSNNHYWDSTNNRLGIGLTNPQRSLEIYSATVDSHLRLSGAAPSVSMGEAITGAVYQAKFGLATASGQYVSGAVAGDFVIISQTGATIWANSGGERMRLNTNGTFSIGNTNSTYNLDVTGTGRFSGDLYAQTATNGTANIKLGTSATTRLTISSSDVTGDATIAVTANHNLILQPNGVNALTLSGTGAATFSSSVTAGGNFVVDNASRFKNFETSASGTRTSYYSWDNTNNDLTIATIGSNSIKLSPNQTPALTLAGTGAATFSSSVTAVTQGLNSDFNAGAFIARASSSSTKYVQIGFDETNTYGWIQSLQQGVAYRNLILNGAGGNVGIGTSSPDTLLHLAATQGTLKIASNSTSGANAPYLSFFHAGNDEFKIVGGGYLAFLSSGTTERMRITSGGNVSIGTTNTFGNLSVQSLANAVSMSIIGRSDGYSEFHFRNNANSSSYAYIQGQPGNNLAIVAGGAGGVYLSSGATSWSAISDERLKTINSNIDNAVDKLLTLRAVNFSWKSDETKKENLGLIAQDLETTFPQVIDKFKYKEDDTEYLNVRYTDLVPVLVKAIQEQQATITSLQDRIYKLENK